MLSKVVERWKDIDGESRTKAELITISLLFENLQGECIILEEKQFLNKKNKLDLVRLFTLYYTTILYAREKKATPQLKGQHPEGSASSSANEDKVRQHLPM